MTYPPRLTPLLSQFDDARTRLITRLHGLTDNEYLWEPVPHCWNIHPREHTRSGQPFGTGAWVMDFDRPEPVPPPVTTIAWRMCHLTNGLLQRADYTTGTRSLSWGDYVVPSRALAGVSALNDATVTWRDVLTSVTDVELDRVGHSQLPWGLDPRLPFVDIIWWVNQELLAHGAEIALLRDLYRAQPR